MSIPFDNNNLYCGRCGNSDRESINYTEDNVNRVYSCELCNSIIKTVLMADILNYRGNGGIKK